MKQRFTSLDLHAICTELAPLLAHCRLTKIYDHPGLLSSRALLFRFKNAAGTVNVVIESGVRMHQTETRVEHGNRMPGGFAAKVLHSFN